MRIGRQPHDEEPRNPQAQSGNDKPIPGRAERIAAIHGPLLVREKGIGEEHGEGQQEQQEIGQ